MRGELPEERMIRAYPDIALLLTKAQAENSRLRQKLVEVDDAAKALRNEVENGFSQPLMAMEMLQRILEE